jgi:hypothetical protein
MSRLRTIGGLILVAFAGAAVPASAHHSVQAVFDMSKPITVTGSIPPW